MRFLSSILPAAAAFGSVYGAPAGTSPNSALAATTSSYPAVSTATADSVHIKRDAGCSIFGTDFPDKCPTSTSSVSTTSSTTPLATTIEKTIISTAPPVTVEKTVTDSIPTSYVTNTTPTTKVIPVSTHTTRVPQNPSGSMVTYVPSTITDYSTQVSTVTETSACTPAPTGANSTSPSDSWVCAKKASKAANIKPEARNAIFVAGAAGSTLLGIPGAFGNKEGNTRSQNAPKAIQSKPSFALPLIDNGTKKNRHKVSNAPASSQEFNAEKFSNIPRNLRARNLKTKALKAGARAFHK